MRIVENGTANATIVVRADASEGVQTAASQLQKYIKKASAAKLPIESEGSGNVIRVAEVDEGLAAEGFVVRCSESELTLGGADEDGVQFAVYHFLEKFCGMRWFFPDELWEIVPQMNTVEIPGGEEHQEPDFFCRDVGTGHSPYCGWPDDPKIQLWGKANKLGGTTRYHRGKDVAKDEFAETHPEYFALRAGERDLISSHPQLCTSNPDVVNAVVEKIR